VTSGEPYRHAFRQPCTSEQYPGLPLEDYLLHLMEEDAAAATEGISTPSKQQSTREEAVRRMVEFGEKHRLSLGEPVTRSLLHEGHRY